MNLLSLQSKFSQQINLLPETSPLVKYIHNNTASMLEGVLKSIVWLGPELNPMRKHELYEIIPHYLTRPYLVQWAKESAQRVYEHMHRAWFGLPKLIDCMRQEGLISWTPIPKWSNWWYGRLVLIPGDIITGYYAWDKWFDIFEDIWNTTKKSLIQIFNHNALPEYHYTILLAFLSLIWTGIYYTIIKPHDLKEAEDLLET